MDQNIASVFKIGSKTESDKLVVITKTDTTFSIHYFN